MRDTTRGAVPRRWGLVGPGVLLVLGAGSGPAAAADHSFTISGSVTSALLPGTGGPIDLRLTNPNVEALRVSALTVTITGVDAGSAAGCSEADFSVQQYAGSDVVVPGSSTRTLSALGVTTNQMPQLRMVETGVNQDGCQRGTVRLAFSATGAGASAGNVPPTDVSPGDLPGTGAAGPPRWAVPLAGLGLLGAGAGSVLLARRRNTPEPEPVDTD
ncbi:MAG TPA: hypothetical protein VMZ00_02790 [Sporichthya sp.]|nr:hypothetical protein [Sporichthya sp.]